MARCRGVEGYDGGVDEAQGGLSGLAAGAHADVLPLGTSPTSREQYGPKLRCRVGSRHRELDVPSSLPGDRLTDPVQSTSLLSRLSKNASEQSYRVRK
jgi:hypothetical protein